ncbi:sulfite exporter TauE/SafE family protein [Pollutibacter soli]|uniref:sulfite exporter TauE/SafE family protein n=1 Tax=Pollutibacter soli TaxID=3034157 RepID=UPI0030134925
MQNPDKPPMTTHTIIVIILTGLAAGMLGGMVGVGGGIIIVPALVYFLAFSQHQAQGTSLALMLFPVGILGVLNYYKRGYVDFRYAGLLAIGFVLGSYLGSKFSLSLPEANIKKVFAVIMIIVAIKMLFFDKK